MFGGPQCPKIEIIRTGREKRKSENVSECAYADPTPHLHPIFCQSLHPSLLHCLLSVLICRAAAGSQADGEWRLMCVCVVCVGWLSSGEVKLDRVNKSR